MKNCHQRGPSWGIQKLHALGGGLRSGDTAEERFLILFEDAS